MRYTFKISVILLVLLTAGSIPLSAQRGMRGMRPDSSISRMQRMNRMPIHRMIPGSDSLIQGTMRHRMMPGYMSPYMCPMWGMHRPYSHGMRPGMGMWAPGPGMWRYEWPGDSISQRGPGMRMLDRIPGLTDQQKKEISDLRQKQANEMQKLRSDMQQKIKEMRDSHRKEVMNILNAEQKKWLEENVPMQQRPSVAPKSPGTTKL
jgi:hypothetical protein